MEGSGSPQLLYCWPQDEWSWQETRMRLAMDLEELIANEHDFISCLTTNYKNETTPYNLEG